MQQSTALPLNNERINSIDVLRGLVMIIMALDHVRDYFHAYSLQHDPLDLAYTSVPIFLTRWITHFCAPVFVFLAGTSAYLTVERKGKKGLSWFLFTRGLWLVILEVTVVSFGWSFMQMFSIIFLQTIWALGISMIALSALIYLPRRIILMIALVIIFGHNALDNFHVEGKDFEALAWSFVHDQRMFTFGGFRLLIAYPVLSWIGVMSAGYCFGEVFTRFKGEKRKRILNVIGVACIILFIAIRFTNTYGDANLWQQQKSTVFTMLSFVDVTKYPPSLLYILMTLGPAILFLAFAEKPLNSITNIISVYGRVPMFYYILHIYFIHIAFIIAGFIEGYNASALFDFSLINTLPGWGYSLWIVHAIWILLIAFLYPLCKSYDAYKRANKQKWWLSYL